jgi:hypothetical protein
MMMRRPDARTESHYRTFLLRVANPAGLCLAGRPVPGVVPGMFRENQIILCRFRREKRPSIREAAN